MKKEKKNIGKKVLKVIAIIVAVIVAVLIVGAIVVIIASRPILDIYPYLNPSARVRARKGRLFDEKQISEIVETNNIEEVENYLRGSPEYADVLDEYPLDKALDVERANTYDFVARLAPKDIKDPFVVMSKKADIDNIKSLLTAKEVELLLEQPKDIDLKGIRDKAMLEFEKDYPEIASKYFDLRFEDYRSVSDN